MREFKRVVFEGAAIAVVGIGIALVANAKNPNGLVIGKRPLVIFDSLKASSSRPTSTQPASEIEAIEQLLRGLHLVPIRGAETAKLFRDPGYAQARYVFVDARTDDKYAEGHIPGAFHLDASLKDETLKQQCLNELLPLAVGADKVIVYCNGGHCDDSIQLALDMPVRGIDPAKIVIDVEGMEQWKKDGMPVERGIRGSDDIVEGKK